MGLYEGLNDLDVIGPMVPVLRPNGPWYMDTETRLITADEVITHQSPWIMVKHPAGLNCRLYFDVLFRQFNKHFKNPPVRCQSCWKVVVKPKTIHQLFDLMKLQDKIKDAVYGCKCGIEQRPHVNGLYGGYFYNRSREEGERCFDLVEKKVHEEIGDIPVFLKRSCTEMENQYGDSEKWSVDEDQLAKEKHIAGFIREFGDPVQPQYVKVYIMKKWIEFACANGDESYVDLVERPLHSTYKKYKSSNKAGNL